MLGYSGYGSRREYSSRNAKRYSSDDIAFAWARQESEDGRCPASMTFEGRKFYSYATCIAEIVNYEGQRVVLVNKTHYSNTTTQHQYHVARAVRHIQVEVKVFEVHDIDTGTSSLADLPKLLRGYQERAEKLLRESGSAQREIKRSRLIVEAYQIVVQMREVAQFFKMDLTDYPVKLPIPHKTCVDEETYTRIVGLRLADPSPWMREIAATVTEGYSPYDVLLKTRPAQSGVAA
jgi:hypothetical protein